MGLGPIMLDLAGKEITPEERERLKHPLVGGVILFTRNYESPTQLAALTAEIHSLRSPHLLIAVDHEGGRVQRFREGFTRLPPMRELGCIWDKHPHRAKSLAEQTGYVLAAELRAHGVDFSFTPVLDLDHGESGVIGNRAFHRDPQAVAELAHSLIRGLRAGGMAAVGKHFPGHGFVKADSHLEIPVDERSFSDIELDDLIPFKQMIDFGLAGVMPAHVIYPKVDSLPAGFSAIWLKEILRGRLGFNGVLFSDDLSMEGASVAGGVVERCEATLNAGCDMALVCNNPTAAEQALHGLKWTMNPVSMARLMRMHGNLHPASLVKLHESPAYVQAVKAIASIGVAEGDLFDPCNTCGNR